MVLDSQLRMLPKKKGKHQASCKPFYNSDLPTNMLVQWRPKVCRNNQLLDDHELEPMSVWHCWGGQEPKIGSIMDLGKNQILLSTVVSHLQRGLSYRC